MSSFSELQKVTVELIELTDVMVQTYEKVRTKGSSEDFYSVVKPFADMVKEKSHQWKSLASFWLQQEQPKHIHPAQLSSVQEQLEAISVQSFFPETSLSRYKQTVQSIRYILTSVETELTK